MYDEPPEPTDEEMVEHEQQQAVMRAPTVRIEGITAEAVQFIARDALQYEAKRAALIAEAPEGVRAMLLARGELTAEEAQGGQGFDLTPEKLDAIGRELSRIQESE